MIIKDILDLKSGYDGCEWSISCLMKFIFISTRQNRMRPWPWSWWINNLLTFWSCSTLVNLTSRNHELRLHLTFILAMGKTMTKMDMSWKIHDFLVLLSWVDINTISMSMTFTLTMTIAMAMMYITWKIYEFIGGIIKFILC